MSVTAASIVERLDTIGTLPTSVAQIFRLINDPNAAANDFERVVRPDVGLTANLLKCANSVFYRATREITSVKDAITRMGLRRVFEVAASASFSRTIPAKLRGYGLSGPDFWGHSVEVAVLADRLGREAGFTYPDLAFTAGLLHDLGKAVVGTWLTEEGAATPLPDGGLTTIALEREVLGTDHAECGELLAQKWNLPKEIVGAARWHHDPAGAPSATLRYLATVVQLADGAAHAHHGGRAAGSHEPLEADALERLNLAPERVMEIMALVRPEIDRTRELLMGMTRRAA
jgi:putative nucleotidyltransferase with HDIG domain